jgi:hypothetical protein
MGKLDGQPHHISSENSIHHISFIKFLLPTLWGLKEYLKQKKSRFSFVQETLIIKFTHFFKPGVEDLTKAENWIFGVEASEVSSYRICWKLCQSGKHQFY